MSEIKTENANENISKEIEENAESNTASQISDNPYAYLDRDFTSEKFKIEIRDLPKYFGISEIKKLINNKLKLGMNKIKAPKKSSWAYVCFRNEDDKNRAIEVLNGYEWKGKKISASAAKPMPDPLVKKRKEISADGDDGPDKKPKIPQEEQLKNSTIPYWNVPYQQQVEKKNEDIKKILMKLGTELCRANPNLSEQLEAAREKNGGLPCEYWDMRSASETDGYRNKCAFTVGLDSETALPTVGFRLGSYVSGSTSVAPVHGLVHIPDRMKTAVQVFEKFIRSSDLLVFNPENHSGHFKTLTCRYGRSSDELMLVVVVQSQNLSDERRDRLKSDLKEYFSEGSGASARVTSLYYLSSEKRMSGVAPPAAEHLWGDTHIHETILGLNFSISPESFFQVNTLGAELLYSSAIELAAPDHNSTVVDICCGTGTIGLCFAQKCRQVLGVEVVPEAVEDARHNARMNKIENCEFFVGKAEEILSSVMYRATEGDIVAIVDPPRNGLHQKAIQQLRRTKRLNRLVYISCDAGAAFKNFVDLGRAASKTLQGDPLVPVRAVSVDMFPHTAHRELLVYFERLGAAQ